MGEMVRTIFTSFTDVITGLGGGIKSAFEVILYADPTAEVKVLSDFAQFSLIMGGVALATGLVLGAFRMIKNRF